MEVERKNQPSAFAGHAGHPRSSGALRRRDSRAEDTILRRHVAIKLLPGEFPHDAERLTRFQREAEVLASLNHPDIAAIHGLEESGGRRFIVMEFVDGETLAHRLLNRPLPADDALDVCRQIAEGLEAAHEHGIIHRDLKPGNVMITADGKVKLLGFGLAKAPTAEPAAAIAARSPTVTAAMTRAGTVLGTPAYMSPEQAKGKAVDKKADIWAFGCILYECLTGKAPFKGETVTETLAKILEGTPDLNLLPPGTPWRAKELLHRCLRKIPGERLRDIGDARIEITWRAGTSKARPIVVPPLRLSLVGIILTRIWALPCRVREGIPRRPGATLPLPWLAPKMVGPSGTLKL